MPAINVKQDVSVFIIKAVDILICILMLYYIINRDFNSQKYINR